MLSLYLGLAVASFSALAADDGEKVEVPAEWAPVIDQLRDDDFVVRENAEVRLSGLEADALPWIDASLEKAGDSGDPEIVRRLAGISRGIRERVARESLENGQKVSINLVAVKPHDILKSIQDNAPRPTIVLDAKQLFGDAEDGSVDFAFEGSYWQAIDKLFADVPPAAAAEPGREAVEAEHDLLRWGDSDFAGVSQPSAAAGVLRVRAARTAIEHSNGKDYFTVTLVPKLEPGYLPDEVALLLKGIRFAGGTVLEPEKRLKRFERSGYRVDTTFQPGRDFTWEVDLGEAGAEGGPVQLDASMQVKARRVEWLHRQLPGVGAGVDFTDAISVTVEELGEESAKLKFQGESGTRIDFNQYSRHGTIRLFELLDEDDKPIKFNIRGSSSGSGGDTWHQTFTCHYKDVKPVAVKALLPGKSETVRMPLIIDDVPIPGMAK